MTYNRVLYERAWASFFTFLSAVWFTSGPWTPHTLLSLNLVIGSATSGLAVFAGIGAITEALLSREERELKA